MGLKSAFKKLKSIAKPFTDIAKSTFKTSLQSIKTSFKSMTSGIGDAFKQLKGLDFKSLLGNFKGIAEQFFKPVQSFLQNDTLKMLQGLLSKAGNTGDLATMAQQLFQARQGAQPITSLGEAKDMAMANAQQIFAAQHAQLIQQMMQSSNSPTQFS